MRHRDITDQIINAYYRVRRQLPHALQEAVYQRALAIELSKRDLIVACEVPYRVYYEQIPIGYYRADILVNNVVIIEVKRTQRLAVAHVEQLERYLAVAGLQVGLLLNFGPVAEIRRVEYRGTFGAP
ncbi:MAG: GxxExxY protein [Gemmatimonadaceae bacterium]|nr:GxxExxY protein [Gemmatimonadaceae bacterium]